MKATHHWGPSPWPFPALTPMQTRANEQALQALREREAAARRARLNAMLDEIVRSKQ